METLENRQAHSSPARNLEEEILENTTETLENGQAYPSPARNLEEEILENTTETLENGKAYLSPARNLEKEILENTTETLENGQAYPSPARNLEEEILENTTETLENGQAYPSPARNLEEEILENTTETLENGQAYPSPARNLEEEILENTTETLENGKAYLSPARNLEKEILENTTETLENGKAYLSPARNLEEEILENTTETLENGKAYLSPARNLEKEILENTTETLENGQAYPSPARNLEEEILENTMETLENGQAHPSPARNLEEEDTEIENGLNLMNPMVASIVLINTFEYLGTVDIMRASMVSRQWHSVASRRRFWRRITTNKLAVANIKGFVKKILQQQTTAIELHDKTFPLHAATSFYQDLFSNLREVKTISSLNLRLCIPMVTGLLHLGHLSQTLKYLTVNFVCGNGHVVNLAELEVMKLKELKLMFSCSHFEVSNAHRLAPMGTLEVFSLSMYNNHYLTEPRETGCIFPYDLPLLIVPKMVNLRKLILYDKCTFSISDKLLTEISRLKHLSELELIHCSIGPNFKAKLAKCTGLKRLKIAPTNSSQDNTSSRNVLGIHQQVIEAASTLRHSLSFFNLGIYDTFLEDRPDSAQYELADDTYRSYCTVILRIPIVTPCKCVKACTNDHAYNWMFIPTFLNYISNVFDKCVTKVEFLYE